MHILTLYQSISRWFLLLTIAVSLAACGGGSGGSGGSDDGSSAQDPTSSEADSSYSINVELRDLDTDELVANPNPEKPVSVQVTLKRDNGDPVASANVTVTTTLGVLTPKSGIVKTNDSGVASLELDVEGQEVGSAGEIVVAYENISTDQEPYLPLRFSVAEPSLQLGYLNSNKQFVPGNLEILTQNLSSKGSTPISVFVQGPNGDLYSKRMEVVFSSTCSLSQPAVATLDSPITTTEGKATSTYTAKGCEGQDSVTASLAAYPSISAKGQLYVMPPELGSIEFVSAEPKIISIRGSGGKETSTLYFKVLSKDDLPISGAKVNFSLATETGDASLVSNFGTTNSAGEVSVLVSSGTVAMPVRVIASVTVPDGKSISTVSDELVISVGIPDQNSFSVAASILNPGGDSYDGATSTITVRAGDFFNNSIPDGTAITFTTEYGRITGSCTTVDGNCSVDWTSQNPRKPASYKFLDDNGQMSSLRTIENTDCPVPGVPSRGAPCPVSLGQPYGARSSILAYALGQETFVDANSNGRFDTGEDFEDLPEAFLDHNEDGAFGNKGNAGSCYLDGCPEVAGDEDWSADLNNNQVYDQGNGIYNGVLCSDAAEAEGTCSKELVHVRGQVTVLLAGNQPYGIFRTVEGDYSYEPEIETSVGESSRLSFYLSDKYNGPLPLNTKIEIESDKCKVDPKTSAVGNTSAFFPTVLSITVNVPDDAKQGSEYVKVRVTVPAPEGSSGTSITSSWQFKCTIN
ncbi:Ig-like domain-containing protein [Microbulbifer variabilis]|uniref:Ig-like domain-containing protein n=1 Tax=Microbulbifer variabilis TaxID=266805 RepID=UPI001CFCD564|nr:Ig-like domain-containing protein [Microbulbifer variabilis]